MWPFCERKKLAVQPQDWVVYKRDGYLHNGVVITVATDGTIVSVASHEDYEEYKRRSKTDTNALVPIYWVRIRHVEAVVGNCRPLPSKDAIPAEVVDELRKLLTVCDSREQAAELLRSLYEGLAPIARIGKKAQA